MLFVRKPQELLAVTALIGLSDCSQGNFEGSAKNDLTQDSMFLFWVVLATVAAGLPNLPSLNTYANHETLVNADQSKLEFYWTVDIEADRISLALKAPKLGWMSVGFSESGHMTPADAMVP
eukprot:g83008.t1